MLIFFDVKNRYIFNVKDRFSENPLFDKGFKDEVGE